jgi:hypothetical protein
LGDVDLKSDAKTAFGLRDWCRSDVMGEWSLPTATISLDLPRHSPAQAAALGAGSIVIGVAAVGGVLPAHWLPELEAALDAGLRTRDGRMILELLPDLDVDKGTALRALVTAAGAGRVLYVGDDVTDADAWREMRAMADAGEIDAAHCVLADGPEVDPSVRDAADASVDGPGGVRTLMQQLAR